MEITVNSNTIIVKNMTSTEICFAILMNLTKKVLQCRAVSH